MKNNSKLALVSLVISTKNEEHNIRRCLDSLKLQTYGNIEIIVVDNNSSDQTKEIAKQYTKKVFNKGPERSAQRNFGMLNKASGNFVMYIDADMFLSENLVETCVKHIDLYGCDALYVPERVIGCSFLSKVRDFERSFYDGTVVDGARFFKASSFKKIGGFDEKLFVNGSGEDWDIDKKIKVFGKIGILDKSLQKPSSLDWPFWYFLADNCMVVDASFCGIYHNELNFQLSSYFKKKLYYARGFEGYIKKWGKDDVDIVKQFSFYYRFFGVFLEQKKWKKIIGNPTLTLGMLFLRFVVGISFLVNKIFIKFGFYK
jgi:glycosyltransferase involved in cell wall biosynthesis